MFSLNICMLVAVMDIYGRSKGQFTEPPVFRNVKKRRDRVCLDGSQHNMALLFL